MLSLLSLWRELSIVALAVGAFGIYQIQTARLNNMELRYEIATEQRDRWEERFDDQNERIKNIAENFSGNVDRMMEDLERFLKNQQERDERRITDIEDIQIPEKCEDIRDYLKDVKDRIRW